MRHTNLPVTTRRSNAPTFTQFPLLYIRTFLAFIFDGELKNRMASSALRMARATGYMKQQSTRPQTLGYGLSDSPVGLLGWIYEKLVSGTDNYPWTDDEGTLSPLLQRPVLAVADGTPEVIEWISIYYFSRAGPAASTRIYYEMSGGGSWPIGLSPGWTSIPLGISYFPREAQFPKLCVVSVSVRQLIFFRVAEETQFPVLNTDYVITRWTGTIGNVVFESPQHDKGGHFAAFEVPEKLAGDLHKMFGKGGPAHGVVPGKDGYNA